MCCISYLTGSSISKLNNYLLLIALSRQTGNRYILLDGSIFFLSSSFSCLYQAGALLSGYTSFPVLICTQSSVYDFMLPLLA